MGVKTIRLGPDGFDTTDEHEADVRDVMYAGRWATPPIPDNRQCIHLLDLQPNEGELACWAYMRFGGPWIDVVSRTHDAFLVQQLTRNLPPSARIIDKPAAIAYDAIHAGEYVTEGLAELDRCKASWYAAEWNGEEERRMIDAACAREGLRLFKIELRCADVGRGLWMKSRAEWTGNGYGLRAA